MSEAKLPVGQVRSEAHEHVLNIIIDNMTALLQVCTSRRKFVRENVCLADLRRRRQKFIGLRCQCASDTARPAGDQDTITRDVHNCAPSSLSWVLVSKSLASWRSRSCSDGSPLMRLTMRPRFTAGRSRMASAQRCTFR